MAFSSKNIFLRMYFPLFDSDSCLVLHRPTFKHESNQQYLSVLEPTFRVAVYASLLFYNAVKQNWNIYKIKHIKDLLSI